MARELLTARLARKDCISEVAQCYHFLFEVEGRDSFEYLPGQFVSAVAPDENGKQQTRAYSIASAASGNRFELCVNRVENGFFSNHLADLPDCPWELRFRFTGRTATSCCRSRSPTQSLWPPAQALRRCAPISQWLFPADGSDRSGGKDIWLVYGTRHESDIYYKTEFEALADRVPNFHYLPTLSRAHDIWNGLRGHVQVHVAKIVEERAETAGPTATGPARRSGDSGRRT